MKLDIHFPLGDDVTAICEVVVSGDDGAFKDVRDVTLYEWEMPAWNHVDAPCRRFSAAASQQPEGDDRLPLLNSMADKLQAMIWNELDSTAKGQQMLEDAIRDRDEAAVERAEEDGYRVRREAV